MLILGGAPSNESRFVGTGTAVGTCGELVQGFTGSGVPFHVTCPIEKSSTVSVTLTRAPDFSVISQSPGMDKIELSLLRTAEYLDIEPCSMKIAHWTDLDIGKGMGSSTADIVAASRALAGAVGRTMNASELASIATSIESSDGSMHSGIVAFNQKSGALVRRYTWWPQFALVVIIPTKRLNTESADFSGKLDLGNEFDEILRNLEKAEAERNVELFARMATRSGELNQRFVPNPYYALLHDRLDELGAIGLNVGHTGTVAGLLFDATSLQSTKAAAAAAIELQSEFKEARVEMSLTPPSPMVGY